MVGLSSVNSRLALDPDIRGRTLLGHDNYDYCGIWRYPPRQYYRTDRDCGRYIPILWTVRVRCKPGGTYNSLDNYARETLEDSFVYALQLYAEKRPAWLSINQG